MAILTVADPFLDQILGATYDIWHEGLDRAAYRRWYAAQLATPWGRSHMSRWALVDGGEVAASAKVYRFDATLDGRAIRVAGFGAVFTQPAHRGRGYARELIERLLERAAADGADAALLFSEIGPDYYARLGFEVIPTDDLALRVIEDARRGAPATMVRAGDDRDLGDVIAMDAVRAAPFRFHLNRDRDLVHYAIAKKRLLAGLGPSGLRTLQFFIAEEGASAAAYVVIGVKGGTWAIESCGDRDPAGARLGAILQVLIARDPGEPRPSIGGWLPPSLRPVQLEVIGVTPSRDVAMIRPLTEAGRPVPPLTAADVAFWKADLF
jgi:GNAT superfamily N-acetyltransferase